MESKNNQIINETQKYITQFYKKRIPKTYVFHNLRHTKDVVEGVLQIGKAHDLGDKELEVLQLAAWFHDVGYPEGAELHEEKGGEYAEAFLLEQGYPNENIEQVKAYILATKRSNQPKSVLEEIIRDADLSHLGKEIYWDRSSRLRQELTLTQNKLMSEEEWLDFELNFMVNHQYHTKVAETLYGKRKRKYIKQLQKQKTRLNPKPTTIATKQTKKKKEEAINKEPELKTMRLGRGVETMFRTSYRTHINLSSIADNKANIMLSINVILISIIMGTLMPQFEDDSNLIIPTVILLLTCLVSMVFAVLATRPKITEGKFSREDIESRKANLLFFGNFYNMPLDDFQWGVEEMIKDQAYLYNSMTKDLYFLGVVLAKKYRLLSVCYNIFMYGVITAVLAFVAFSVLRPF